MIGLVLEGGANRTYYSIGVLDAFLDNSIDVDFMVGVSAGIANGVSYISKQRGRGLELGMKYICDKRYMGMKYFFKRKNRSYYNLDFVFDEIPNKYVPFDYDTYDKFPGKVYAVITNIETGEPEYREVESTDTSWKLIQASCALPFMFKPIEIDGNKYFDGGCCDPLPVKFAFESGCDKVITIITRELSYEKQTEKDVAFSAFAYRKHKNFANALKKRSDVYNESREFLFEKVKSGEAFVFAPTDTNGWKRTERRPEMLKMMYDEGYSDAIKRMDELKTFLNR
ncbi:MAG: patatin family protein [Clostridia bacterium]|nr:patatin family protein [Clostridia bacterium]